MRIEIPDPCMVVLIGASGSGKSTFGRVHFKPTEIVSSDGCRGLVSDDENDLSATTDAFELVHFLLCKRLTRNKLTVVDATNVQFEARRPLLRIAHDCHALGVAIVFNVRDEVCHERNRSRPDRQFGPHVVRNQNRDLRRSLGRLRKEGFRHIYIFDSPDKIGDVEIVRTPLWTDRRQELGPFDIIGDIHGCYEELAELLSELGYAIQTDFASEGEGPVSVTPPAGRRAIFLGDLVDRGPDSPSVLKLVMSMVESGAAFCVPGNHDVKLLRKLSGKDVQIAHGLAETLEQLATEPPEFIEKTRTFLDGLVSHFVLDEGRLVVAHAGMREEMQGRASGRVRDFALFGETTGETDDFGLPVRFDWASEYRGKARVVYGHTPVPEAEWLNHTINIDTGCVFGGKLTALRYPEMELVSVPAKRGYAESKKPFLVAPVAMSGQQAHDDVLDMADVLGRRHIQTRLRGSVTIREENAIAALEAMSRFAANPKWLVYLPPTMSPTETSSEDGLLEHPAESFAYFASNGVTKVVCEEKHMGSRAVAVVCQNPDVARHRFGVESGESGIIVTRTGRRFFDDEVLERALLGRIASAATEAGLWEGLNTGWMVLDCELMPWSAKAQELLKRQYAPVGASSMASLSAECQVFTEAAQRLNEPELQAKLEDTERRLRLASAYVEAYRRYCWKVDSIEDYKLAPFHLLATEGTVHVDKDHFWHMETLARICSEDPILLKTPYKVVETMNPESVAEGAAWWTELTGKGGEGMVIKPLTFTARGPKGLVQPAVKCRGKEYLRIIYGPEYDLPGNLSRLRRRGLATKRSLAVKEFALGIEALERFVRREPLRRVHECVFGVLAMESESVDPRL
ncbi:MAG: polynucleotide kinase-phosphatase [Armatimonadetes bacterium]|nr:polynucleotide kinase-phosphatase [Armatimonadota bacterium]